MYVRELTRFFMWCTIINGGLLALWSIAWMTMPGLVYKTQERFFPVSRETFTVVFYGFLGVFKIIYLVFNVTPFIVLLIIR